MQQSQTMLPPLTSVASALLLVSLPSAIDEHVGGVISPSSEYERYGGTKSGVECMMLQAARAATACADAVALAVAQTLGPRCAGWVCVPVGDGDGDSRWFID